LKILLQRSGNSSVWVNQEEVASIESGLVVFVCLEKGDSTELLKEAVQRLLSLRIFEDEQGKMNRSIVDIKGEILLISQFTLSWNGRKGLRPSFDLSMPPQEAKIFFKLFSDLLREQVGVQTGVFGASMDVRIQNLGPVTFHLSFP
jgi:D-aminoacyl-tRNA deacylase